MKLVDILAREVKIWPEGYGDIGQAESGKLHVVTGWNYRIGWTPESYTQAEDWASAVITRAEWQAAVDALNADKCEHSYANNIGCPECGELNAPKVVEWAKGSLPPIGSVVEWDGCTFAAEDPQEKDLHVGDQVTIIAHLKDGGFEIAAFTFNPGIHNPARGSVWVNQGAHGCFRPIRTAEQVAAEERENAAIDLAFLITGHMDRSNDCAKTIGEIIHDAGYRKEPKPCGS